MSRKNTLLNALPIVAAHYGEQFGVRVHIGNEACADVKTIYVPNVPDSYPHKDVVWGYLIHEAGHVRCTDMDLFQTIHQNDAMRRAIFNALEDVRVEHIMMQSYPGVRHDLEQTVEYMKATGGFVSVSPTDAPGHVLHAKILLWLRSEVLQQPLRDMADAAENAMQKVFPEGVNTRLGVLLRKAFATTSTKDCLELTDSIMRMLHEEAENELEKELGGESNSGQSDDDSQGESNSGQSDDDSQGESNSGQSDDDSQGESNSGQSDDDSQGESNSGQSDDDSQGEKAADRIMSALNARPEDLGADAFNALKAELSQAAAENGNDAYLTVPVSENVDEFACESRKLLSDVQSTSSKLKSQLVGLVQASRENRDFARRSGRKIDAKHVTRILAGDTRIFRKRENREQPNTAVHILTDLSSSMSGEAEHVARQSSMAIALALESIPGVCPAVTYFCGYSQNPVFSAVRHGESVRRKTSHFYKSATGSTPMAEAIWYAGFELSKRCEERKIIIVITDGEPNSSAATHAVLDLCRNAEIEAIGIGIRSNAVREYFDSSIVISSIHELRTTLFKLMSDTLTV